MTVIDGQHAEVPALLAASVLVLRDPFEVLMIRRHERSSFVPNAWVFPGGAADDVDYAIASNTGDDSLLGAMRVTAARELFEETGLWLGTSLRNAGERRRELLRGSADFRSLVDESPIDFSQLVWTSHWITPVGVPKRYDTYFFVARAPERAIATVENDEAVEIAWISPADALRRHGSREFQMVFPTIKNLEALVQFTSIDQLLESRRHARDIPAILPVIVSNNGQTKIVIP